MRKYFILFLIIKCYLLPVSLYASNELDGYEIRGKLEGLFEGEKVTLVLNESVPYNKIIFDSSTVKNGEFYFKGHIPEGPRLFYMRFSRRKCFLVLIIDNGEILFIKSDMNLNKLTHGENIRRRVSIIGNPSGDSFLKLEGLIGVIIQGNEWTRAFLKRTKDSLGYDKKSFGSVLETKSLYNQIVAKYLMNNTNVSKVVPLFIDNVYFYIGHEAFLSEIYNSLPAEAQCGYYGRLLNYRLPLCVGRKAPVFSFTSQQGKTISLDSLIPQSNIIIINFWKDNIEGQQFNKYLTAIYNKYHINGLNIISVFTGSEAVRESPPGIGILDSTVAREIIKLYHIQLPTTVLINKKGEILAWDTSEDELEYYIDSNLK